MKYSKLINNNKNILYFFLVILIIQLVITQLFTNTKKFSIQAYFMNIITIFCIYKAYKTYNILYLLIPILIKLLITFTVGNIPKYITTEYLYNDYFETLTKGGKCECEKYYTEGYYNNLIPYDVKDNSNKNQYDIQEWCEKNMWNSEKFTKELMISAQNQKFEWMAKQGNIKRGTKVLEIGFGKLDLMKYLRDNYGAEVSGINLSTEQVEDAKNNGFHAFVLDYSELHENTTKLDKYDVIITNGTLEYLINWGESEQKWLNLFKGIDQILNKNGKVITALIHWNNTKKTDNSPSSFNNTSFSNVLHILNTYLTNPNTISNLYNLYMLSTGNEGSYPECCDGYIKYPKNMGYNILKHEDHTIDYLMYSYNWLNCQYINECNNNYYYNLLKHFACYLVAPNYLESYLCYTYRKNLKYVPWLWQFVRQKEHHYRPVSLYWSVLQKP